MYVSPMLRKSVYERKSDVCIFLARAGHKMAWKPGFQLNNGAQTHGTPQSENWRRRAACVPAIDTRGCTRVSLS